MSKYRMPDENMTAIIWVRIINKHQLSRIKAITKTI
jgi:hypothetical protein